MESKAEIVAILSGERRVEQMILCITRHSVLDADLSDLAQMVYLYLLEYDEDKIRDLWEKGEINFFLIRVIKNQYFSDHSPWYKSIRRLRDRSTQLEVIDK